MIQAAASPDRWGVLVSGSSGAIHRSSEFHTIIRAIVGAVRANPVPGIGPGSSVKNAGFSGG
jgi:hypothetical protein